jgi:hypothetical protein
MTKKDAELYLSTLGIPRGLPTLHIILNGTSTFLKPGTCLGLHKDYLTLMYEPLVLENNDDRQILLCLDPDAPKRNENGAKSGTLGPRLHWFRIGQRENIQDIVKYAGPKPLIGKHRYIFILFKVIKKIKMPNSFRRKKWDAVNFISENKERLKPIGINFFYCYNDE